MNDRTPVEDAAELALLDEAEMIEGYHDGRSGEPEPGGNRSKSYWHGWRNGRVDGHHAEPDAAMRLLAQSALAAGVLRLRPTQGNEHE